MDKQTAQEQINQWGTESRSFIFLIDFEFNKIRLWDSSEPVDDVLYDFNGFNNYAGYKKTPSEDIITSISAFPKDIYIDGFQKVQEAIHYGNSFLLNLTARSEIQTHYSLKEIFQYAAAKYKFYLKDQFVCFSPESFVKISNNRIFSYPMKGTIDASIPNARDLILNDPKESSEHNTIVDLIRNDLSKFAKNVSVPRFRYIDKIEAQERTLLQVSSEIMGELPEDYKNKLGDILFSMLPAGSISGAPKKKTIEIIRTAEQIDRSYYTGIAGYFDGNALDSCVLIRYIEKEGEKLYYRSGGGITFMSDLETEYQELLQKIYVPTH